MFSEFSEISSFLIHHWILATSFAAVLAAWLAYELICQQKQAKYALSASDLVQKINHGQAVVIDIRAATAFQQGSILHAHNIPETELDKKIGKLTKHKNQLLVFVCEHGQSSQKVIPKVEKLGFHATYLIGGLQAWREAQLPVVKP